MKNTKQAIVELIGVLPGLTTEEISQKLNLTKADIRYHVSELHKTSAIITTGTRIDGRGRPARTYRLGPDSNFKNSNCFIETLLNTIKTMKPENAMQLIAASFPIPTFDHLAKTPRLGKCIEALEGYQYNASWEASRGGPRIIFRNCPYGAIVKRHPELCQMDRYLINQITGLDFIQTSKINLETSNPASCIFQTQTN